MTWNASCDEELLAFGEVGGSFTDRRGVGPGPGRKLVDEVVAGCDELFGCYLTICAEGGGVRDGSPFAELVERAVNEVETHGGRCRD